MSIVYPNRRHSCSLLLSTRSRGDVQDATLRERTVLTEADGQTDGVHSAHVAQGSDERVVLDLHSYARMCEICKFVVCADVEIC